MKVHFIFALIVASASAGLVNSNKKVVYPRDLPVLARKPEGRITNGKTAAYGQFPYQVALSLSTSAGAWWCGGSLISNNFVLTAGHCTSGATNAVVYLGATVLNSPLTTQRVSRNNFIIHPNFVFSTLLNDISLIKISTVQFNQYINKVRLPAGSATPYSYAGVTAIASGWGLVSDSATDVPQNLQYASLQVLSNADCAAFYNTAIVTPNIICTANVGRVSVCTGDSGGPLVVASTGEQIGIVSFVSPYGCEGGVPGGYTRVTSYMDWIRQNSDVSF